MKANFNLIDEPWIPCIPVGGGNTVEVGVREALLKSREYSEIYSESPLITVSLYRMLLAILYRACGPQSRSEWRQLWLEGIPKNKVDEYLQRWYDRFDLFDKEHPFYQTAGLEMETAVSLSRLATEQASGHNVTLFDHATDDELTAYTPAESARLLVAAQSFALGFGKSGRATIGAQPIDPPYFADAILIRGITVWLQGANLSETLIMNLVPMRPDEKDIPSWEMDMPWALRDTKKGAKKLLCAARGVVDRYTWQSRLVRLLPEIIDNKVRVREVYLTQGRSADKSPDDPMKAYRMSEEEGFVPISLDADKAVWRDSHAILSPEVKNYQRPKMVDLVGQAIGEGVIPEEATCLVNVVGLATEAGKAGKFILWRHDRFPTPVALFRDPDLVEGLELAINQAEQTAKRLNCSIRKLCRLFLSPNGAPADPELVSRLANRIDPRPAYWSRLEERFYTLLRELPIDRDGAIEKWREAVREEFARAFRESAGQLGSSTRAIRARAQAYRYFDIETQSEV